MGHEMDQNVSSSKRTSLMSTTALVGALGAVVLLGSSRPALADCTPAPTAGDDTITCTATHTGDLDTGDGNDIVTNSGTVDGQILLGLGNDELIVNDLTTFTAFTRDGGDGTDILTIDRPENAHIVADLSNFLNFETLNYNGIGNGSGAAVYQASGFTTINITGLNFFLDNSDLSGADVFLLNDSVGVNSFELGPAATVNSITGDASQSLLTLQGTVLGSIDLGDGDDSLTLLPSASVGGLADGGVGTDVLTLHDALGSGLPYDLGNYTNFEVLQTFWTYNYTVSNATGFSTIHVNDGSWNNPAISGNLTLLNSDLSTAEAIVGHNSTLTIGAGTIIGSIRKGDTADADASSISVNIEGTVLGDVILGAGNDSLMLIEDGAINGVMDGGAGLDSLVVDRSTVPNPPPTIDFANVLNFESFEKTGTGNLRIVNAGSLGTLTMSGGRLVIDSSDLSGTLLISNSTAATIFDAPRIIIGVSMLGDVQGSDFSDSITVNQSDLTGNIALGGGDDEFGVSRSNIIGTIDGGLGDQDKITLFTWENSTQTYDLSLITNFETFIASGSASTTIFTGASTFNSVELLYGLTGVTAPSNAFELHGADIIADSMTLTANFLSIDANSSITINGLSGVVFGSSDDTLVNQGTITGDVDMGDGNDSVTDSGTVNGQILLGLGDDQLIVNDLTTFTGFAKDGGAGTDTLRIEGSQNASVDVWFPDFSNFEILDVDSQGSASVGAASGLSTVNIIAGHLSITNNSDLSGTDVYLLGDGLNYPGLSITSGSSVRNIVGNDQRSGVEIAATVIGNIDLGGGDDRLSLRPEANIGGLVDGGAGQDTVFLFDTLNSGIVFDLGSYTNFEILQTFVIDEYIVSNASGFSNVYVNAGTSNSPNGAASLTLLNSDLSGAAAIVGHNSTLIIGAGSSIGSVSKGVTAASDAAPAYVTIDGTVLGDVTMGDGIDTITVNGAVDGSVLFGGGDDIADVAGTIGADLDGGDGNDSVTISGTVSGQVVLGLGDDTASISGAVTGGVDAGDGADNVALASTGSVGTNVLLGLGDDTAEVAGAVGGDIDGGDGIDSLTLIAGYSIVGQILNFENLTAPTGADIVLGGSATVNNISVPGGTVTLGENVTLASSATVDANIVNNGTVSPGASPGTLTITGSYTQSSTGVLAIEVIGLAHDVLAVGGTAALDGVLNVTFTFTQDEFVPGQAFEFLTATGGVTGTFATVNANTTQFLDATIVYGANGVSVQLDRSSFLLPFFDAGRRAIAAQLDALAATSPMAQAGDFIRALTFTERALAGPIIDQLASEAAAGLPTPVIEARQGFLTHVAGRLDALSGQEGIEGRWISGISGYGAFGNGGATDYTSGGAMAVSAYGVNDRLTVGFAMAGTSTSLRIETQAGDNGHTALDAAVFAGYRVGRLFVSTVVGTSYDEADTERSVIASDFEGRARGTMKGLGYTAALDARYGLGLGGLEITPEASLRLAGFHHGTYEERELGNLGLRIEGRSITSLRASTGLSLGATLGNGAGLSLRPELGAYYERELGERTRLASAAFIADPTTRFDIVGAPVDASRARFTAGLSARLSESVSAGIHAEALRGNTYDSQRITGGLRVSW